jgi:hypothetical protein
VFNRQLKMLKIIKQFMTVQLQNKTGNGINDEAMKDDVFEIIMTKMLVFTSKIVVNMRFTKTSGKRQYSRSWPET